MSRELLSKSAIVALVLVLAASVRIAFLVSTDFNIDADEAIVGLMAKHISEGRGIPIFYYGQHYMGSPEPMLVSLVMRAFGPTVVALKIVPLIFSVIFVWGVYLVGREVGGIRSGQLAALFAAVPPAPLLVWSGKARGGFIELLCVGIFAFLLCMRMLKSRQRLPTGKLFTLGFILGFGWWMNNQIIYFMLPIGLMCIFRFWRSPRDLIIGAAIGFGGFFLGGLPFWLYNIENGFVSFAELRGPGTTGVWGNIQGLFATAIPILLGAKRFWEDKDTFPFATVMGYLLVFVPIVFVLWRSYQRRDRSSLRAEDDLSLLLFFLFALFGVFSLSSFGYLSHAPRYLLPFYAGLFPLLGFALAVLARGQKPFATVVIIAIFVFQTNSIVSAFQRPPGEPVVFRSERVSHSHDELLGWLREQGIHQVRTNYWIGYRLAFESEEEVVPILFGEPHQVRIPEYEEGLTLEQVQRTPLVLTPRQADVVQRGLQLIGYSFEVERKSHYVVLYHIQANSRFTASTRVLPDAVVASHNEQGISLAFDSDRSTRWGSAAPQRGDMWVKLYFDPAIDLQGMNYQIGAWKQDVPRALRIVAISEDGTKSVVLRESDFSALSYLEREGGYPLEMRVTAKNVHELVLQQRGADPIFDWSIAEFEVFGKRENVSPPRERPESALPMNDASQDVGDRSGAF